MLRPAQVRYLISDYYWGWGYWLREAKRHPLIAGYCHGMSKAYQTMYWSLLLMLDTTDYYTHGCAD